MTPKKIVRLRKRHDLTKVRLSELLGHNDKGRTVFSWESGTHPPNKAAVAALRYLDMLLTTLNAPRLPKLLRVAIEKTLEGE